MTGLRVAFIIAIFGMPSQSEASCIAPPHCPCDLFQGNIALDVQVESVFTTGPDDNLPDLQFVGRIEAILGAGRMSAFALGESHVFEPIPASAFTCGVDSPAPVEGDRRIMFVRNTEFVSRSEYIVPDPPMDASGRAQHPLVRGYASEVAADALVSTPPIALADLAELVDPIACAARFEPPVIPPCNDTPSGGCVTSVAGPARGDWPWLALLLGWVWRCRGAR